MYKYKKRRRSSWPSQLLAAGLVLGSSCWITTPAFADDCGDPGASVDVTIPLVNKSCAIETGSDEDWFRFETQSDFTYTISATNVGKDVDVAIQLYESDGKTRVSGKNSDSKLEGGEEKLDFPAHGGTYQVQVFQMGYFGSNTGYQLSVTETVPQAKGIQVIEGNNQTIKAGGTPTAITFQLVDTNGKGMDGKSVQFQLTQNSKPTSVSIPNSTTQNGGQVIPDLSALSALQAGTYTIKATAEDKEASATLTVTAGELASLTLTANDDCQGQHSADKSCTLKVVGKDAGGNTVTVEKITLSLNSTTKEVTVTNGVTEDLQLKKAGSYTIKATSPVASEGDVKVEVVAGTPTTLEKQSSTCQDSQPANQPCDLTFKLIDVNNNAVGGKTVNFALNPSGDGTTLTTPAVSDSSVEKLGEVKVTLTPATTLTASQSYTISATVDNVTINPVTTVNVTVNPPSPPPTTYSLTVVGGGNQSVVNKTVSQPIILQVKEVGTSTPSPEKEVEVTLTVPNVSNDTASKLLENVALNANVAKPVVIKTDSQGQAEVNVSFANAKDDVTGVITYLLSAKLKDNSGVADYTNVFLLEKPLDKLKTWPTLETVDEKGNVSTGGDGKGIAVNATGEEVNNATFFHGGLSLKDKNEFLQKPANKVKLAKDKDGKPIKEGKDKSDLVMVQGVIQVDPAHVNQPAEIVVFGENDSPTASDAADGCYMLGSSAMIDLQTLGGKEVCQRFREKKMTEEDMIKLIPFKRGVTLTDKVLVEMYTGTFYYGADSLRIYFGYRLADGTLVYNGSNPIYITIEETLTEATSSSLGEVG